MARRVVPMIAFPQTGSMYVYIYSCVHMQVCIVYVVKEVAYFSGAHQLMGVVRNRMLSRALQTTETSKKKAACSLHRKCYSTRNIFVKFYKIL